jgi:hypothetical protein
MADALDSKSSGLRVVRVQLPPPVLEPFRLFYFFVIPSAAKNLATTHLGRLKKNNRR